MIKPIAQKEMAKKSEEYNHKTTRMNTKERWVRHAMDRDLSRRNDKISHTRTNEVERSEDNMKRTEMDGTIKVLEGIGVVNRLELPLHVFHHGPNPP